MLKMNLQLQKKLQTQKEKQILNSTTEKERDSGGFITDRLNEKLKTIEENQ